MAAYRRVDDLWSPADWLPVHRDYLRAQRSVSSMGSLYLLPLPYTSFTNCLKIREFFYRKCKTLMTPKNKICPAEILRIFSYKHIKCDVNLGLLPHRRSKSQMYRTISRDVTVACSVSLCLAYLKTFCGYHAVMWKMNFDDYITNFVNIRKIHHFINFKTIRSRILDLW